MNLHKRRINLILKITVISIVILTLLLVLNSICFSGDGDVIDTKKINTKWKALGPGGGGAIVDVVVHPSDSNIVWVETDLTGIFKSIDGGNTFRRMSGPVEKKEQFFEWMRGVGHELVYDLSDPKIMYWAVDGGIYTKPGLYKSTDGGETWFKLENSPDLNPAVIIVDYNGVVYGIKHKKLFVSLDKGETWQQKPDVPTYYCGDDYDWRRRFRIFIYVTKDNKLVIGDRYEGTGIYYSENMGNSWKQALEGMEIMDITCSPVTPDLIMAYEQDGRIFRSADGGKNFNTVSQICDSEYRWGQWPAYYGGIAINKKNHVMAIGRRCMAFSSDGGATFTVSDEDQVNWDTGGFIFPGRQDKESLFKCTKLKASINHETWYCVDGQILKKTQNNGDLWIARYKGIHILCVYTPPVIDSTNPDIIHVGAGDNGHYYSKDGGITWETSESEMRNIDGLFQDPNNPDIWYKMYGRNRNSGSIFRSEDGGMNWQKVGRIPMPHFRGRSENDPSFYSGWIGWLVVDPTNSKRIFATHRASDGLYVSEDRGHHFEQVLELIRPWQLKVTSKGTVFICTWDSKGLYRSDDHGKTFQMIHDGKVHDFVVHPNDDNIIYANVGSFDHAWASARVLPKYERNRDHGNAGKGKLYKTVDGGKTWSNLGAYDGFALYIEPNYPNVMLMSTRDGGQGIMRSSDAGETWISIHDSHNNYHPRGFVYGGIPGRVYSWNHNLEKIDNIQVDSLFVPSKAYYLEKAE